MPLSSEFENASEKFANAAVAAIISPGLIIPFTTRKAQRPVKIN